ncbi:MAG: hypothetical protein IPO13_14905 [Rhodocyclaceae bacterium]|nr:hypothetical protein [Rhodocyclaceae bacterium]
MAQVTINAIPEIPHEALWREGDDLANRATVQVLSPTALKELVSTLPKTDWNGCAA